MSKATKVIRVSLEVYENLAKQAIGFETPNDVITRLLNEHSLNSSVSSPRGINKPSK